MCDTERMKDVKMQIKRQRNGKNDFKMEFEYEDIDSDNQHLSNLLTVKPSETIPLVFIIIMRAN